MILLVKRGAGCTGGTSEKPDDTSARCMAILTHSSDTYQVASHAVSLTTEKFIGGASSEETKEGLLDPEY